MQAEIKSIVFEELNKVACRSEMGELAPQEDGIVMETLFSCVSAGTELAKLTGLQEIEFPLCLGNRAIGRVVERGEHCTSAQVGDLVFSHTAHTSHTEGSPFIAKLPEALDRPDGALLGMAMVALTGVEVVQGELGDTAVVTGGGLVGNLAAQLLELSGIRCILVEPVEFRREVAQKCGISYTTDIENGEDLALVTEITEGDGVDILLECTGMPAVVNGSTAYLKRMGTMVLVGSPRGEYKADMTPFMNRIHLNRPHGDLTLKGAHEWKVPLYPTRFLKHSMLRNVNILSRLMVSNRLKTHELLTHVLKPENAREGYSRLLKEKDKTLGVVFDWCGKR